MQGGTVYGPQDAIQDEQDADFPIWIDSGLSSVGMAFMSLIICHFFR